MKPTLIQNENSPIPQRVQKIIEAIMFSVHQEFNNDTTRRYVAEAITLTLQYFLRSEDIYVICDETNNPLEVVNKGEFKVDIVFDNLQIPYVLKPDSSNI